MLGFVCFRLPGFPTHIVNSSYVESQWHGEKGRRVNTFSLHCFLDLKQLFGSVSCPIGIDIPVPSRSKKTLLYITAFSAEKFYCAAFRNAFG